MENLESGDWIEIYYEGYKPFYGELKYIKVDNYNNTTVITYCVGGVEHFDDPYEDNKLIVKKIEKPDIKYLTF